MVVFLCASRSPLHRQSHAMHRRSPPAARQTGSPIADKSDSKYPASDGRALSADGAGLIHSVLEHALAIACTIVLTLFLLSACVAPASRPGGFDNPDEAFLETDRPLSNEDRRLQRITGNFNNTGRADVAYAFLALCGAGGFSTGCEHALYLQSRDGRYIFEGAPRRTESDMGGFSP